MGAGAISKWMTDLDFLYDIRKYSFKKFEIVFDQMLIFQITLVQFRRKCRVFYKAKIKSVNRIS